MIKENLNGYNLVQLMKIRENQYRNSDCTIDYCREAVEQRIGLISQNRASKARISEKKEIKKRMLSSKGKRTKSPYKKVLCADGNCSGYAMVTIGMVSGVGMPICPCGAGEMVTNDLDLKAALEINSLCGF